MRNGSSWVTLDFSYVDGERLVAEDVKGRKLADSRDWPIRRHLVLKHIYKSWELREVRS